MQVQYHCCHLHCRGSCSHGCQRGGPMRCTSCAAPHLWPDCWRDCDAAAAGAVATTAAQRICELHQLSKKMEQQKAQAAAAAGCSCSRRNKSGPGVAARDCGACTDLAQCSANCSRPGCFWIVQGMVLPGCRPESWHQRSFQQSGCDGQLPTWGAPHCQSVALTLLVNDCFTAGPKWHLV